MTNLRKQCGNKIKEMVDNFEYGNFENLKTPNRSLCWELSSPLSASSYCRSVIRPTGWGWGCGWGVGGVWGWWGWG